ncbi:carboxypeptidase regulatory-like domain-containing protein [Micromonosporaceae bacterium B7E4]
MTITGVNASLNAGQTTTLSFTVRNNNGGLVADSFDINVTTSFNELQCQGNCDFTDTIGANDTKSYSVTLRAGNVAAGQTRSGNVRITAEVGDDSASAQRNITVRGPEAPPEVQTVAEVSGRITNEATGDGVPDASVRLTDGQGRTHTTDTSSSGSYRFTGSRERPIAPGRLQIRATKDGITDTKDVNGAAGARINNQGIQLALAGTPSATPETSAEPTEDAAEEEPTEEAGAEESQDAGAADQAATEDSGGLGSWVLILAGGLLVALGVGAIVLLLMRRKEDGGDDDEDGPGGPGGPGPRSGAGAGRGGYDDATRVTNRAGADPTMVNRGGNLADAPTMMHSAPLVDDEFPDPYGAPLPGPQTPGYGAGQQGWGGNANGYGDRPGSGAGAYGNAPGSGAGYGAPASGAGYGNAPGSGAGYGAPVSGGGYPANGTGGYDDGYDEPTGRYTGARGGTDEYGPAADPYETNAYRPSSGAGQGGYEPTQQYGRDDDGYEAGGYGTGQGGYGDEPRTGAGYDRADDGYGQPGYADRAGYDQQGYDADRAGYDQPTTGVGYDQPRGGYDDQSGYDDRGGYDQQQAGGGYYDEAPRAGHSRSAAPQQSSRSERRSLDWLDD